MNSLTTGSTNPADVFGWIQSASVALDRLWLEALSHGSDSETAVNLGDASFALHRALIALAS